MGAWKGSKGSGGGDQRSRPRRASGGGGIRSRDGPLWKKGPAEGGLPSPPALGPVPGLTS